jgi:hypothetical protein
MTVILSPGRDDNPARPFASVGALPLRENYTQAQIEQAVESMMMRLSTGHSYNATAARRVAQLVGPYVNDAITGIPPGSALVGNQAFERMVLEKAPVAALASNDPNTVAEAVRRAREANVTSSTFAAAQGFLHTALGSAALAARAGGAESGDRSGSVTAGDRSSTTYSRNLSGLSTGSVETLGAIGVGTHEFRALEKLYGREATLHAAENVKQMGLHGKGDLRLAAEAPEVAGALAKGDLAAAQAAAGHIKDPKKKKRAETLIEHYQKVHNNKANQIKSGAEPTDTPITNSAATKEKTAFSASSAKSSDSLFGELTAAAPAKTPKPSDDHPARPAKPVKSARTSEKHAPAPT